MSYNILKLPTENQVWLIGLTIVAIVTIIAVLSAIENSGEVYGDYQLFIDDMNCDTLKFQALNHEWSVQRGMALQEHGGRC